MKELKGKPGERKIKMRAIEKHGPYSVGQIFWVPESYARTIAATGKAGYANPEDNPGNRPRPLKKAHAKKLAAQAKKEAEKAAAEAKGKEDDAKKGQEPDPKDRGADRTKTKPAETVTK